MRRIRGITTRRSLRGYLAAARYRSPARHRRLRQAAYEDSRNKQSSEA